MARHGGPEWPGCHCVGLGCGWDSLTAAGARIAWAGAGAGAGAGSGCEAGSESGLTDARHTALCSHGTAQQAGRHISYQQLIW